MQLVHSLLTELAETRSSSPHNALHSPSSPQTGQDLPRSSSTLDSFEREYSDSIKQRVKGGEEDVFFPSLHPLLDTIDSRFNVKVRKCVEYGALTALAMAQPLSRPPTTMTSQWDGRVSAHATCVASGQWSIRGVTAPGHVSVDGRVAVRTVRIRWR